MRTKKLIALGLSLCLSIPLVSSAFSVTSHAASGPDLVFTNATITSRTSQGVYYRYTIKNQGDTTIPSLYDVSIQNYYSANTIFGESIDTPAGGRKLLVNSSLAPGQTYTGTFYSIVKQPVGKNYLTFKIDYNNAVNEKYESNNTSWLYVAPKADLIFTNVRITSKTPTQVNYTYTIKNNGTAAISNLYNVSIQNFYSANTIFNDGTDTAAGGSILGLNRSLAAGESYTGNFAAYGAIPVGKPYITAKIDWGNVVSEISETNNTVAIYAQ